MQSHTDSAMSQPHSQSSFSHPNPYTTSVNPQQPSVTYSSPADAAAYQQWLNDQIYNRARSSSINYGHVQPAAVPQLYLPAAPVPAPMQYTTLSSSASTILPATVMHTPTNAAAASNAYIFSPPNQPSSYWLPEHLRAVQHQHPHDTAQQQYSYTAPTTVQNPYSAYFMQPQMAEAQPTGTSSANRKRSSTTYAVGQQQHYYASQPTTPAIQAAQSAPYGTLQTPPHLHSRPMAGHVDRRLSAPPASSSPSAHLIALPHTLYPHPHAALPTPSGGQPITSSDATTLLMQNCLTTYESGITMRICTFGNCGKKFDKPSALRRHLRTHTGEKPFACPYEGCTMTFSERGNAKRHEKTHTGEKNYPCLYAKCNERFGRRQHQMYHMQSKHMLNEQQIQELEQRYPAAASGIEPMITEPSSLNESMAPPSVTSGEYATSTSGASTPVADIATPSTSSSSTYAYPSTTRNHAFSLPSTTSVSSTSASSSSYVMSPQSRPHLVAHPSLQLSGRYTRRTHPQPLMSTSSSGQSSLYRAPSYSGYENTPSELISSTHSASSTSHIGSASEGTAPCRRQSEVVLSHSRQRSLGMEVPSSASRMQSSPPSIVQPEFVRDAERLTSYDESDKDPSTFEAGGETKRRRTLTEDDMAQLRRMQLSARSQQTTVQSAAMSSADLGEPYYSRPSITHQVVPEGDETADNSGRSSGKDTPEASDKALSADVPAATYETETSIVASSPKEESEQSETLVRPPALRITPEPATGPLLSPLHSNKSLPFLVSPFAHHPALASQQTTPSSLFQTVSAFFTRRAGSTLSSTGSTSAPATAPNSSPSVSPPAEAPQ